MLKLKSNNILSRNNLKCHLYFFSPSKELDISRNQLSGIEEDFAEKLLRIDDIRWDQNPFICDICHLEGILNRIHAVGRKITFI
jgi:hypothetical protein